MKEIELKMGFKNKNVNWTLTESFHLLKNYNIKKPRHLGDDIYRSADEVSRKIALMGLSLIKRKGEKRQKVINNILCKHVLTICNYYNKNGKLNMGYIKKIRKKHLPIVKSCFPKVYFNRMEKETEVVNFIEKNKRLPNLKAKNKKEKRLGEFVNNEQYNKRDLIFCAKLEELKIRHGILSKTGEKKPRKEETMKELVKFVKINKRLPTSHAYNKREARLGRFFEASCKRTGILYNKQFVKPYVKLFVKYMTQGVYWKTLGFYKEEFTDIKIKYDENYRANQSVRKKLLQINENRLKRGILPVETIEQHNIDKRQDWYKDIIYNRK